MIFFPNAKINIGLFVTNKREDGFHNIESIFYPIALNDALEMRIMDKDQISKEEVSAKLYLMGDSAQNTIIDDTNNTVIKAFNLLKKDFKAVKSVNICLDKRIPVFAGLGGGSSDGSFALMLCNYMFNLGLTNEQLIEYASLIGSDCNFFLKNTPQFVYSKGEKMQNVDLSLKGLYLLLIKPDLNISTKEAYKDVNLTPSPFDLRKLDVNDIHNWKNYVRNDFEVKLFERYPLLQEIKQIMYDNGALYAQMSGSGSTIYGFFEKEININKLKLPISTFVYQKRIEY